MGGEYVMTAAHIIALTLSILVSPIFAETPQSTRAAVMTAVGDSITAGFANATLVEETQRLSYPNLIAKQMGAAFGQPYISEPGLPYLGFRFDRKKSVLDVPYVSLRSARRIDSSNDC